jgi:hypothetical protein
MAILAYQAGGNYYFNKVKYSDNVKRGLDWLVEQQGDDGRLFGNNRWPHSGWYEHGIGTFALADACATALASRQTIDSRYLEATKRAVKFQEKHQYAQGGWQYALDSPRGGDTSVTGWQILALKSAIEADIDVEPETMQRVLTFYEKCGNPQTGHTSYKLSGGSTTPLRTAVGLVVQQFIAKKPNSPLAKGAAEFLRPQAKRLGATGDFYTLYNATLGMYLTGGDAWTDWNNHVRDAVLKRQVREGCARGSWMSKYGRTLDTAWAVLTLEVYYRYATEKTGKGK